jgi:hypothetical protein
MTNTFKRRVYRLSLASTTCFLIGILVYDLGDIGIVSSQVYSFCYIIVSLGIIMSFKTLDTWSSWNEDNSIDSDDKRYRRNPYPLSFYVEAAATILIIVFLLARALARNWPTSEEDLIFMWGLIVAGGCVLMASLSSSLNEYK